MKPIFSLLALLTTLSSVTAQSSTAQSSTAHDRRAEPSIVVDRAGDDVFPARWLTPDINAHAELADEAERPRSKAIVAKALSKYPSTIASTNLQAVYVLGGLEYRGVATGGAISRDAVYVVVGNRYSAAVVERVFHAEFSSILLRNDPQFFDADRWQQINPPGFQYLGSGVEAVRRKQASNRLQPALHENGFLHDYSQASIEEDFNSHAALLFMGDPAYWEAVERYPLVRAKAELTMDFYGRLDAAFSREFFPALRGKTMP